MEKVWFTIESIGRTLLPVSFIAYLFFSFLFYIWDVRFNLKIPKAIWYLLNIILVISKDQNIETITTMILCFEAIDAIFDYFEEKKRRKN